MKEQVSVDSEYLAYLEREVYSYKKDIWERTRGFKTPVLMEQKELQRLERLDENIKRKTLEAKARYDKYVNNNSAPETVRSCIEALKLLESLDK